jgi:hypothetical protein
MNKVEQSDMPILNDSKLWDWRRSSE